MFAANGEMRIAPPEGGDEENENARPSDVRGAGVLVVSPR